MAEGDGPAGATSQGTLYVVATPIGNLADASPRMVDVLRSVDIVAAEDTRRSRTLLLHFAIRGPSLVKLDAHSTEKALSRIVDALEGGRDVAVVTDAGTPAISDPGAALVRRAVASGFRLLSIPGPSAVTAAVAVSGLVEGPFLFLGFLPRKGEKRRRALARIAATEDPVILFEAPNRIRATLAELAASLPERRACVARELTKMHEQTHRGTLVELAAAGIPEIGEMTLVLGPAEPCANEDESLAATLDEEIARRLARGDTAKTIASDLAPATGRSRREIYQRAVALAGRV